VPFREKFYYSNVVYMSAGVAAGKAGGTDWNTLVTERIFEPLGMGSTTYYIPVGQWLQLNFFVLVSHRWADPSLSFPSSQLSC